MISIQCLVINISIHNNNSPGVVAMDVNWEIKYGNGIAIAITNHAKHEVRRDPAVACILLKMV